jgi:mannonate dehydratase
MCGRPARARSSRRCINTRRAKPGRAGGGRRKALIENAPAGRVPQWTVVESIPVPDDICASAARARAIEAWIESMQAVAAEGIRIICYNVMPVVDWTRTDLDFPLATGATALRFDHDRFAAFDLHVLKREARPTTTRARSARAKKPSTRWARRDRDADAQHLGRLPGAMTSSANLEAFVRAPSRPIAASRRTRCAPTSWHFSRVVPGRENSACGST